MEPSGVYSVASLRKCIDRITLPFSDRKWMWNSLVPGKVNILAWRIIHGRLPTLANLAKFGISSSTTCKICHESLETENHLFVECGIVKEVWQRVSSWWRLLDSNFQSIGDLLNCKKLLMGHQRLSDINEAVMLVFLWVIWNYWNLKAHSSGVKSHTVLAYEVQSMTLFWINARKRKGEPLGWVEWCCDPILECYSKL